MIDKTLPYFVQCMTNMHITVGIWRTIMENEVISCVAMPLPPIQISKVAFLKISEYVTTYYDDYTSILRTSWISFSWETTFAVTFP